MAPERAEVGEVLGEQHLGHGHQEVGVGAGADRHPLVGVVGGLGATRVDDDDLPAAGLDGLEAPGEVGRGAEAAVRRVGVGAEDQQVVGAIEVGHRDEQRVAVEVAARHVLGHLVDGGGREHVGGAERLDEGAVEERGAEGVHARVAQVDRHGVAAVALDDPPEPGLDRGEGLVPGDLLPGGGVRVVAPAHEGPAEAVGVGVEVVQRRALGADEAAGEGVVAVAADAHHGVVAHGELEPAAGLAERAGAVVHGVGAGVRAGGALGGAGAHGSPDAGDSRSASYPMVGPFDGGGPGLGSHHGPPARTGPGDPTRAARLPGPLGVRRRAERRRHGAHPAGGAVRLRRGRRLPRAPVAGDHLLPLLQPAAEAVGPRPRPHREHRLRHPPGLRGPAGRRGRGPGQLRHVARPQRGRGGLHGRRAAPGPGPGHRAARVPGGGGARERPRRAHRHRAAHQPQDARRLPRRRLPGGQRLRGGRHRGAPRHRAHRGGAAPDRGARASIGGGVGDPAALAGLHRRHRRRPRAGRHRPRGLPQPGGRRLRRARLPGEPGGRPRGQRAGVPERPRHPRRGRPRHRGRARRRCARRGRGVRSQAGRRPGDLQRRLRPPPRRHRGAHRRAGPRHRHAGDRPRVDGCHQHRPRRVADRQLRHRGGAARQRGVPHAVRHPRAGRARPRPLRSAWASPRSSTWGRRSTCPATTCCSTGRPTSAPPSWPCTSSRSATRGSSPASSASWPGPSRSWR